MDTAAAEVSVLGACLMEPTGIMVVADFLKPGDFYQEQNREVYQSMLNLWSNGDPVSDASVCGDLTDRRKLKLAGGPSYVASLSLDFPDVASIDFYAKKVKDAATIRALQRLGKSLRHLPDGDPCDAVSSTLSKLIDISADTLRSVPVPIGDHVARAYRRAIQLHNKEIENKVIMTGMDRFDRITGGLKGSDLIVIGARPSVGKSAFSLHLSRLIAEQGYKVLFISLEMSSEQIATRLLAAESGVPYSRIQDGYLSIKDPDGLKQANSKFVNLPLIVDDRAGQSIADIQTKARREMARGGLAMVVVDYLQIAASDSTSYELVTGVSNGWKALAKDLDIPVVALSQLSRGIEHRDSKRPVLADLKQSGAVEQDSDLVMMLYNYGREDDNQLMLEFMKHRNGGLGKVLFSFEKNRQQFEEIGGSGE